MLLQFLSRKIININLMNGFFSINNIKQKMMSRFKRWFSIHNKRLSITISAILRRLLVIRWKLSSFIYIIHLNILNLRLNLNRHKVILRNKWQFLWNESTIKRSLTSSLPFFPLLFMRKQITLNNLLLIRHIMNKRTIKHMMILTKTTSTSIPQHLIIPLNQLIL
jgi:hypothetical protein